MKKMNVMKKFLLMLFVAVVPMTLATSCSDDDDDDDKLLAQEVAGSYYGSYAVTELGGDKMGMALELKRTADNEITVSFGDIVFAGMATASIPDVTGIKLTGTESNVTIVESTQTVKLGLDLDMDVEGIDLGALLGNGVDVELTISGTVRDGEQLSLKAVVKSALFSMLPNLNTSELTINISAEKGADPLAEIAKGKYEGSYTIEGLSETPQDIEVTITKTANEEVTISFGEISFNMGSLTVTATVGEIEEVALAGESSKITIPTTTKVVPIAVSLFGNVPSDGEVTISGEITDGDNLNLTALLSLPVFTGTIDLTIKIEAEK